MRTRRLRVAGKNFLPYFISNVLSQRINSLSELTSANNGSTRDFMLFS
jgi:hypothetical protein